MKPIKLDASLRSVVVSCASCPPWRELRAARPDALRAAADHMDQVHGQARAAKNLRERAARIDRRHAD